MTSILQQRARVLVVDDEHEHAATLARLLAREGFDSVVVHQVHDALQELRQQAFDVVLTDLVMPGQTGIDLLRSIRHLHLPVDVILMTAFGTVERAVEAMRSGAHDFLAKPIKRANLIRAVERSLERRTLLRENEDLRNRLQRVVEGGGMIGAAASFRRSLRLAEQAAASDATVLVHGESGTGKELVARYIHARSARHDKPFVALHCAALPESIIESELFGHEPGAFTGATRRKPGRFETADTGTLFLDEIGELPPSVQVKLLRVLQEGEVQRLGSNSTIRVDVRIVAATHRDLAQLVRDGKFREDLFYRLHVIPVMLPPLRERREDIELLAQHFVTHFAMSNGRTPPALSPAVRRGLESWHWPGNVRELQNVIERAVVLDADGIIDLDDLPGQLGPASGAPPTLTVAVGTPLADVERRLILATLEHTGGDKALAASLLGVGRRTIYRKLEEFDAGGPVEDEGDPP